ncbi:hypothetical protein JJE63_08555 [Alloprevotella tannerae]|uniref:hypothetical protein n=1 Tax=Alloprevotella tannerae TaxID=76122 RepID=UPI001EDA1C48|nr:hypothetical protein [Alloprevotella tannerae]MCG2653368.1 hypothetical protein [Alloprevotella tannerae]
MKLIGLRVFFLLVCLLQPALRIIRYGLGVRRFPLLWFVLHLHAFLSYRVCPA